MYCIDIKIGPSCEISCTLNLGGDEWPNLFRSNRRKSRKRR